MDEVGQNHREFAGANKVVQIGWVLVFSHPGKDEGAATLVMELSCQYGGLDINGVDRADIQFQILLRRRMVHLTDEADDIMSPLLKGEQST